jgi:methylenetetrahydrofolate--tRNA-(uracil-5-)-methyltransferase
VVIASGPLTSPALAEWVQALTGEDQLSFFDAIAPIAHLDSIDMDVAWRQSRYDKAGPGGDAAAYINCPMDKDQYEAFIDAVLAAPKTEFKDWEHVPYFDGCLPIEVMAERGRETLRHGPMKPVGLTNPHMPDVKPWAVVQLRQDNALGSLWNMVGFQTKLKHAAQTEVFRTIPGLGKAVFARLGGLHRNTFINSPRLLDSQLRLKAQPRVRFAGQITGVEGYVESAAIGLIAGRLAAAEALGALVEPPPATTALGALVAHITGGHLAGGSFQPMNINYGLLPPMEAPRRDAEGRRLSPPERGRAKKRAMGARALAELDGWLAGACLVEA